MKRWESSELSNQAVDDKPSLVQKKLAPLNEGGPVQLLKVQVIKSYYIILHNMAIKIFKFPREGYKVRQIFDLKSNYSKEVILVCEYQP